MRCEKVHQSGRLGQLAESCLQSRNPEQSSRRFRANGGEGQRSERGQTRAQQGGRRKGHTHTHDRAAWLHHIGHRLCKQKCLNLEKAGCQ